MTTIIALAGLSCGGNVLSTTRLGAHRHPASHSTAPHQPDPRLDHLKRKKAAPASPIALKHVGSRGR